MSKYTVELPSKMVLSVRPLTGAEIDSYANVDDVETADPHGVKLISDCCTVESYGLAYDSKSFQWKDLLVGDHLKALMYVCVASMGPHVDTRHDCNKPNCGKEFYATHNLLKLETRDYDEDALRLHSNKEPLETDILAGSQEDGVGDSILFRLLTISDTIKLRKAAESAEKDIPSLSMAMRLTGVSGIAERSIGMYQKYLKGLEQFDWASLQHELSKYDGGVETGTHVTCPHCKKSMEVELPLDLPAILRPTKKLLGLNRPFKMFIRRSSTQSLYQLWKSFEESHSKPVSQSKELAQD